MSAITVERSGPVELLDRRIPLTLDAERQHSDPEREPDGRLVAENTERRKHERRDGGHGGRGNGQLAPSDGAELRRGRVAGRRSRLSASPSEYTCATQRTSTVTTTTTASRPASVSSPLRLRRSPSPSRRSFRRRFPRSCRGSRRPADFARPRPISAILSASATASRWSSAALALEAGAARPRRRGCDRRHLRLPPTDDCRLPRRLARRAGRVVGVDGRARGSHRGQHSDLRAAVAGASPRPPLLAGADDDPGDDCALDRGTGRRGGRDRDRLRDVAALGLRAGCRRSLGDAREPLEPARQPGVSDRGALPVDDGRGGDGGARDRGVRRRGDPGRRGRCARARPLQQSHGRGDRRPGGAGGDLGQGSLPP